MDERKKNTKNNRSAGFELVSLQCTQLLFASCNKAVYKTKNYTTSTAMLLILENAGEGGPGPGATKATSFHGHMFQHSAKGKGQMPHGCIRLAKSSACC